MLTEVEKKVEASVLYFGPDEWNRVQVLESAGYAVRQCQEISDLKAAFKQSPRPAVVVINSFGRAGFRPAIDVVQAQAVPPPVIVFPGPGQSGFEKSVDLVVPPLTPPEEWLKDMADLLSKSRAVLEDAVAVNERPATLIQELAIVRAKSIAARQKPAARKNFNAAGADNGIEIKSSQHEKKPPTRRIAGSTKPPQPQDD